MSTSESMAALFMEITAETRKCRVFLFKFHVILCNFRGFLVQGTELSSLSRAKINTQIYTLCHKN